MKFDNVISWAAVIILIATVVAVISGTLAIPVVLALNYSLYWLFLYAGYAFVAICCVLYYARFYAKSVIDHK